MYIKTCEIFQQKEYHTHFTNEEAETQGFEVTLNTKVNDWNLDPGEIDSKPNLLHREDVDDRGSLE